MQVTTVADYISAQLRTFFPYPESYDADSRLIAHLLPVVNERYARCAARIKVFNGSIEVDFFDIRKYPIFLYFLYRTLYEQALDDPFRLKDRLYCLNKYLHGCSLFYKADLPSVFLITYGSSIVLGGAGVVYGEDLVCYQGVTIGSYSAFPILGSRIVLMPNVVISGSSVLGENVVVSTGVRVVNSTVPSNTIAFQGERNSLIFKDNDGSYIRNYLHY